MRTNGQQGYLLLLLSQVRTRFLLPSPKAVNAYPPTQCIPLQQKLKGHLKYFSTTDMKWSYWKTFQNTEELAKLHNLLDSIDFSQGSTFQRHISVSCTRLQQPIIFKLIRMNRLEAPTVCL